MYLITKLPSISYHKNSIEDKKIVALMHSSSSTYLKRWMIHQAIKKLLKFLKELIIAKP